MRRTTMLAAIGLAASAACAPSADAVNEAEAPPGEALAGPEAAGQTEHPAPFPDAPRAPEPAAADGIPGAFHGRWDTSRAACDRPGDGRIVVEARAVRFHESVAEVETVAIQNPRSLSFVAAWQGEGETWRASRQLILSEDGSRLTVSGEGMRIDKVRCP